MGRQVEFTIKAKMDERWVDHFCTMLEHMQRCGRIGHSSVVAFYSDGDGDFRPEFEVSVDYNRIEGFRNTENRQLPRIEVMFDAG